MPTIYHDGEDWEIDGRDYLTVTVQDAVALSRNKTAFGFDLLRWGRERAESHMDLGDPIAVATPIAVRFIPICEFEKDWIEKGYLRPKKGERKPGVHRRRQMLVARSWRLWANLSRLDADFMSSLLWVPSDKLSPLEAIARAAE